MSNVAERLWSLRVDFLALPLVMDDFPLVTGADLGSSVITGDSKGGGGCSTSALKLLCNVLNANGALGGSSSSSSEFVSAAGR